VFDVLKTKNEKYDMIAIIFDSDSKGVGDTRAYLQILMGGIFSVPFLVTEKDSILLTFHFWWFA